MITTNTIKPELKFNENLDILNKDIELQLDNASNEVIKYMKENKGKGQSEDVKDKLYKEAQELWNNFSSTLEDVKYNFYLNRKQAKFLKDLIKNKLEYDTNTVFFAIELADLIEGIEKLNNDEDYSAMKLSATEVTYIYHLLSKHKVKGLSSDTFLFVDILLLIGKTSKIFDFYNIFLENLSTDITTWVTLFEDGITEQQVLENTEA